MKVISLFQDVRRYEEFRIIISVCALIVLILIHVFVSFVSSSYIDIDSPSFGLLNITSFVLAISLSLIVITKGIMPIAINCFGIVLIYGSIVVPTLGQDTIGTIYYKASLGNVTYASLYNGSHGILLLGIFMIIMSVIIGYKPSILYTRNRPQSMETFWSKYPVWKKEMMWIGINRRSLIDVALLVSEKERYLLWRYEYVLASINENLFLVPVNSLIPSDSVILRESSSGKIVGVDKYIGYLA
jgi:hypothetical protein